MRDLWSEHYNNIQKEENNKKKAIEQSKDSIKVKQEQSPSPKVENLDPNKSHTKTPNKQNERPLKCLETLAQKAGITFDEKYEMEKSQSPAQQVQQQQQQQQQQAQQMPLQITPEQYQQLQQFQIQQAYVQQAAGQPATIHVKQEYASAQQQQQQQQQQGISAADLKSLQDHHQNQMQQMQIVQESPQSPHQNSQNALQQAVQAGQVPAEWQHGRVQVLQQPLQNTQYLPQMYSPQLVMSGNFGLGQQQQIQLIAASKPFGNQLTPQMLTASGKPVLTSSAQASFGGYPLPPIPSSQSQTVVFSPLTLNGVTLNSSPQAQQNNQQSILPTMQTQSTPTKSDNQKQMSGQKILQKVSQGGATQQQQTLTGTTANHQQQTNQQCVQVSQTMPTAQLLGGQTMQFASPWQLQGMTPFWTNGIQPQTLLTANPIFIRGTNPDGTPGMFIQQSPTQTAQQTVQSPHNQISLVGNITQTSTQKVRPASDSLTAKPQQTQQRPTILPQGAQIRPASSAVSTQTAMNQNANLMAKTPKVRTKQTPVRPAAPNIKVSLNQQTGQPTMMQQVVTPGGVNKMVVMSNINGQFTPVLQQNAAQQILANNDKLKTQQQQQVILQQAMANMTQNAVQQQIAQIQLQQQQQQFLQQSQNAQQLMAAQSGNIQQVVLQQHPQQLPTVTVTSGVSLQQSMPNHLSQQQGIMTKPGTQQVMQMQPVTSQSASVPSSLANSQIVTSVAGTLTADTSNSILGPLTSPQTPLQPPQNPLIAMTTLSASPMSGSGTQKEKSSETTSVENRKTPQGTMSVTLSPMKRSAEDTKQNDAKKACTEELKKPDESTTSVTTTSTGMSSPVVKTSSAPTTPISTSKTSTVNSPLAAQNGESEGKKSVNTSTSNSPMLKNELPKAMVKPNVLTHVIEGYVIQESTEPFPVARQRYSEKENDEPPTKKQAAESGKGNDIVKVNGESSSSSSVTSSTVTQSPSDKVACEQCGKLEKRSKLKKERFCSINCARTRKSISTDGSPSVSNGEEKNQVSQSPSQNNDKLKSDGENGELPPIEEHVMLKWSVTQVCDFIKNLPGCSDYAEDFKLQEIDGQALLLLKENHLVSAMGMKLGPALKIVNKIESMRVSKEAEPTETPPEQQ
ncbi:CLUMA_CG002349, isoform A [Clunio marinus]|uniref:CLUMA_CG002349, isoform A n=1 Tax=Clunio marinus TaxID=568069 RepID=A0A1J1HKJ8_9DIPT|nr:CLUMA_CG002349, isoform A [Clunio marinus]